MTSITLNIDSNSYPIHITNHIFEHLTTSTKEDYLLLIDDYFSSSEVKKYTANLPIKHVIRLKAGETLKSLENYQNVLQEMLEKQFTKNTTIIAVGGGTIGDFAGFIAATYQRGISYIQVPTTLLAMVDASIGGKTALNLHAIKNVLGAFHQPTAVYINTDYLNTLPQIQLSNGYAEIIKMAMIKDKTLLEDLKTNTHISTIIKKALFIKKAIVEKDPYDSAERKLLNYGHTIGHALESYHSYKILHGFCVAKGIKQMIKGKAFEEEIVSLFKRYHLNEEISYDKDKLYNFILHDKKRQQSTITLAIVETLGEGKLVSIPIEAIKTYL